MAEGGVRLLVSEEMEKQKNFHLQSQADIATIDEISASELDVEMYSLMPTKLTKWIEVQGRRFRRNDYMPSDLLALKYEYQQIRRESRWPNQSNVRHLSRMFHILSGKWVFYIKSPQEVDEIWRVVIDKILKDEFCGYSSFAKVSTFAQPNHAICICNKHFNDRGEILSLEKIIRSIGITQKLYYKPDIYTYCGINYSNNSRIRPVTYVSNFNMRTKQSVVINTKFRIYDEF